MVSVKKGHFVPQFYLKGFASTHERLHTFNKFTKKSYISNVRDTASEFRFYDIHPDIHQNFMDNVAENNDNPVDIEIIEKVQDPQFIEHALGEKETVLGAIFPKILKVIENGKRLTDEQRGCMAEFIALQYLRTPEIRRTLIDLRENILTNILRKFYEMPEAYAEYDERRASLDHAQMMFDPNLLSQLINIIANHVWIFGENFTSHDLYTSDTPVVMRSHSPHPHMGIGIGSYGIEIAFPLTPRYILSIYDRKAFPKFERIEERTIPLISGHVEYYNSLQVLQSYRSIYSRSGDFLSAVEICAEHPEVCTPDRIRIQTT